MLVDGNVLGGVICRPIVVLSEIVITGANIKLN